MKKLEAFYKKNKKLIATTFIFGLVLGVLIMIYLIKSGQVS